MAGKSTFLRQNALIAILAQIGSFVPAAQAHIGVVDRLFSRVGAADDLARGRSTFMVEMVETAGILNLAGPRSLVILDEIGRGTATYDGLSLAWAVVEHLHEVNRCRALFATHFHELTALAAKLPRLACHTLRVKEWRGEVVFLHEVAAGHGRPFLRHPCGPPGRPAGGGPAAGDGGPQAAGAGRGALGTRRARRRSAAVRRHAARAGTVGPDSRAVAGGAAAGRDRPGPSSPPRRPWTSSTGSRNALSRARPRGTSEANPAEKGLARAASFR